MRGLVLEIVAVLVLAILVISLALGSLHVEHCSTRELIAAALSFDFGDSPLLRGSIRRGTLRHAAVTAEIVFSTTAVIVLFGVPLGMQSALHSESGVVRALRRVVDAVSSAPVLVWCTLIYLVMARVIGKIPGSDDLPVVTLVLSALALVMGDRLLADMVQRVEIATRETLNEPYMRTVRAGGFGVRRHLMQSLVAPVATAVQSRAMFLISGAIIVELLFDLPGLGSQITQSLQSGDQQPMVTLAASMALVLFGLIFRAVQRVATRLADRRPAR